MSLLDDVSIVVTPNGYKAGTLYGVLPVPTEGSNVVVNGDFETDSNWIKGSGWSIASGKAKGSATTTNLQQLGILQSGKTYKLTFTISDYVSGSVRPYIGTVNGTLQSSNGTFTEYITSLGSHFYFDGVSAFTGSIDNVSIKEWIGADMDVTRATAATRVDEDGLVNYAEILGSEEVDCGTFDCPNPEAEWILTSSANIANGKLNVSAGAFDFFAIQTALINGNFYKISIEVVVTNGSVLLYTGNQFATISSSGFYNYYFTSNSTQLRFRSSGSGFIGSIDNVSIKEVTKDNVPRIDYTGGGCPHILAEPQRTNEVTYSEDFSQWTNTDITFGSDGVSPSGETNANLIQTGTAGSDQVSKIFTLSATNTTTYSVFIKRVSGAEWIDFLIVKSGFSNSLKVWFNINTGSVGSNNQTGTTTLDNASIESFGNNWYKLNVTTTDTTNNTSFNIRVRTASADGSDTRVNDSSYYLWGMQLEAGSYSTSYIPTSGSTVTRNQDTFIRDGIGSLINDSEGVLFSEVYFEQTGLTNGLFAISDGTFNNILMVRYSPINKLQIESTGGVNIIESSARSSGTYKIAVKYDSNGVELWVDGNKISETSTQSTMSGINELMLGKSPYGNIVGCKVKQLQVYNTALTDEQLLQLTGESGTDFYESYAEMATALTYTIQ